MRPASRSEIWHRVCSANAFIVHCILQATEKKYADNATGGAQTVSGTSKGGAEQMQNMGSGSADHLGIGK